MLIIVAREQKPGQATYLYKESVEYFKLSILVDSACSIKRGDPQVEDFEVFVVPAQRLPRAFSCLARSGLGMLLLGGILGRWRSWRRSLDAADDRSRPVIYNLNYKIVLAVRIAD